MTGLNVSQRAITGLDLNLVAVTGTSLANLVADLVGAAGVWATDG